MIKLINPHCKIRIFLSLRLSRKSLRSLFFRKLRKRRLHQLNKAQSKNRNTLKRIPKKKLKMISRSLFLINLQSTKRRSPPRYNLTTPTLSLTKSYLLKHLKESERQLVFGVLVRIYGTGWCLKLRNASGSMQLVFMDLLIISLEISLSATNMSSKMGPMVSKFQRAQKW